MHSNVLLSTRCFKSTCVKCTYNTVNGLIDHFYKWRPIYYSFVCMLIRPSDPHFETNILLNFAHPSEVSMAHLYHESKQMCLSGCHDERGLLTQHLLVKFHRPGVSNSERNCCR